MDKIFKDGPARFVEDTLPINLGPHVCVEDFFGRMGSAYPVTFWADYFPDHKITVFGGDWSDVPDMPGEKEPTEEEVWAWARRHGALLRGTA